MVSDEGKERTCRRARPGPSPRSEAEWAIPDWRYGEAYRSLAGAGPQLLAWEWLRRDQEYRSAAVGSAAGQVADARRWGLHRFEDPRVAVPDARPVWTAAATFVLAARAVGAPAGPDALDMKALGGLASLAESTAGEHLLICDGCQCLRVDFVEGTLTEGPVRLHYEVSGLASAAAPLAAIRALVLLVAKGRLVEPGGGHARRRDLLALRAFDALRAGASQQDIARHLLGHPRLGPDWRIERPSLRSQAQRLARDARRAARAAPGGLLRRAG